MLRPASHDSLTDSFVANGGIFGAALENSINKAGWSACGIIPEVRSVDEVRTRCDEYSSILRDEPG